MANYQVDIEVALRGARELKVLKDSLKGVNKEVGRLNAATIKAGKTLKGTFSAKDIGNVNNYSKAVAKAERALRNAAFGTQAEERAVKALVTAQKEFNQQLDRQNKLLKEEERLQGVNQPVPKAPKTPKARRPGTQTFGISGIDFMPIGGGANIPGSPLARQAKSRARFGSAVSAGAFPLLFGGGPGMALGGALGGAISGSTFGPASIALQVLGGVFDQLAAQAASLGAALNPATADINAIVDSLGMVGSPAQDAIQSLEELAGEQVALEEATKQLSLVVGDEGVEALAAFGDASTRFSNALTQVTTQILAQIARLTGPIVKEIATSMEIGALLSAAQASKDPRQVALQEKLAAQPVQAGAKGMPSLERVKIETQMVELQKKIRQEEEKRLQAKVEAARVGSAEHVIAKNDLAIAQLNGDLTNDRIFNLEKANIFQEARAKAQKKGADLALIELERTRQLKELENKRADLTARANEKSARLNDREERKKQRAIERATKAVEREMERADAAFDKASRQLDDITNKHEDKMAFEREYSRLIQEGSTPAAAKQAVELQKQLLELDRIYDKQLEVVNAKILGVQESILELEIAGGITAEYEKQLDLLKKRKEELEGKKGKAKGAITKDLAPETGRDKIEAERDRVQAALNELIDPANQVILAAQAIGDAFSESFKGLITGSMSAQEALANLFSRTADHFADMAAQMIAKQIQMQVLGIALNFFSAAAGPRLGGGAGPGGYRIPEAAAPKTSGIKFFNEGGYVSGPTRAVVGEGGESEYVIPESKMRESMARYSRGARGSAVIPENGGGSGAMSEGGGTAVAAPIDVRYTVERINNVDYVTADQFQAGMRQAANEGAKQGEQQTLKRLQMSSSTRKRVGM